MVDQEFKKLVEFIELESGEGFWGFKELEFSTVFLFRKEVF
jgi:hypothetical protein